MCLKRLFKKEKKEEKKKMDLSKYKIVINIKTMCAYENLTGKPFIRIETEDEVKHLFYCSLIMNNEDFSTMPYSVFEILIEDEQEFVAWLVDQYTRISRCISQFGGIGVQMTEGTSGETNDFYMSEAAAGLIVRMGLDPHYVMYEMDQWEMTSYYEMMKNIDRDRLTEERLWTYLQVLPHIGKKLSGPEKLLPFPWEKETSAAEEKQLNKMTPAVMTFLMGKKEENGE